MSYLEDAIAFTDNPPYTKQPYSSRNWGGKWHSVCSYHGKLKPAIAHFLIKDFTKQNDVVLDPLCGVGTIPFEACQQNRIGIGNDLSRMAFCVTKCKIEQPDYETTNEELKKLDDYIKENIQEMDMEHIPYSSFGFNKSLSEYFEAGTLAEIVLARDYFSALSETITAEQALLMAAVMHILHGNRPYALSRRSHPLTPYAPSGEFEHKSLIAHTKNKVEMTFKEPLSNDFKKGRAIFGDCQDLKNVQADAIITSPPFANSLKFYMQNWMRLWFSGWDEEDFTEAEDTFFDARQNKDMSIYRDFFNMCSLNLKQHGVVILHLGKNERYDMAKILQKYSDPFFRTVHSAEEDVRALEKHGIKDKGGTVSHQFLFLEKR